MKFRKQLRILNPEKKRQRRNSFIHCFKIHGTEEADSIFHGFSMDRKCRQANTWARYEEGLSNNHSCLWGSRKAWEIGSSCIPGLQTQTKTMLKFEACYEYLFGVDHRDVLTVLKFSSCTKWT